MYVSRSLDSNIEGDGARNDDKKASRGVGERFWIRVGGIEVWTDDGIITWGSALLHQHRFNHFRQVTKSPAPSLQWTSNT